MTRLFVILVFLLTATLAHASVTVTVNGTNHTIPQTNEKGWGNNVTAWIQAISANTLQPSGGAFTLTAETDFGSSYGLKSIYLKSRATNPAGSGVLRLGNAESIGWRNAANSANLLLTVDSSNNLTFNGINLLNISNTATITGKTIDGDDNTLQDIPLTAMKTVLSDANKVVSRDGSGVIQSALLTNSNVSSSAAIDFSKLATLSSANILVGNGSNVASSVAVTGDISLTNAGVTAYAGTVPINKGGTGQTTKSAAFDALSPNTTEGDLTYRNATTNTNLPIGSQGQYLGVVGNSGNPTIGWASFIRPCVTRYTSGTSSHNITVAFLVSSASATAGATYTNNGVTFTVKETISSETLLFTSASNLPAQSGTLTKSGGTGDSTITFTAYRVPVYTIVDSVGGGGGGMGSGTSGGNNGGNGAASTFGTSLLSAPGGAGGTATGAAGGSSFTINSPAISIIQVAGGSGQARSDQLSTSAQVAGSGGNSFFGGAGAGNVFTNDGYTAAANSGSGGGGGGLGSFSGSTGGGGSAGGYLRAMIPYNFSGYPYATSVGAGGTAGTAGTSGQSGGAGGSGLIIATDYFQ